MLRSFACFLDVPVGIINFSDYQHIVAVWLAEWARIMVHFIAYLLCKIFFRDIHISGKPYSGPSALWAANHTSAIVDPALVLAVSPVFVRPLAKHTLWENPVMRVFFLALTRAIPVFRIQDMAKHIKAERDRVKEEEELPGDGSASPVSSVAQASNGLAFQAVSQALHQGDRVLVFPEGISHDQPYLYKLKTGIARMALQALQTRSADDFQVTVQPMTIDYFEKDEFRSDVAVHFCEPFVVNSPETPIAVIMEKLTAALHNGYASFFTWDEKRNWQFIYETIHGSAPTSARSFSDFVEKYRLLFDADDQLLGRCQTMRRMLAVLSLSPSHMEWSRSHRKRASFLWLFFKQSFFYLVVTLPLQLLEAVMWYIPYKICGWLAQLSTNERDLLATMKIGHGIWIFPLWASLCTFITGEGVASFFPDVPLWFLYVSSFLTPIAILILSTWAGERSYFMPGYLRLVKVRLFQPRMWTEFMAEWETIRTSCLKKVTSL